jgi:transcriptional regulator with XRE-family HTH domain
MSTNSAKRITRELTPEEQERLKRQREQIAKELPDLAQRDQLRKEAQEEATLSGALRRAIHASPLSLTTLASQTGITALMLDEFLTGERTLRSDVLDRLAAALGFSLQRAS